jgi:predicted nucleic acid-binding Zn ribbon protein
MQHFDTLPPDEQQLAADWAEQREWHRERVIERHARPYPDPDRQAWVRRQLERWFAARESS